MAIAFVFPGQGAQRRGMGANLFDEVPEYREVEPEVDAIVGYSMRRLCTEDPQGQLNQTRFTQAALYVVNALHYFRAARQGERADFLAGHSLGEYNALLAAGAFDFTTGLRLVTRRGELMSRAAGGGMAAVVGMSPEQIVQLLEKYGMRGLDIANFNSGSQTVISGPTDEITRATSRFEAAGARLYLPLPVSAAFHSRYMQEVAQEFGEFLRGFQFGELRTPVISNVTGAPYPGCDAVAELLSRQIASPVRWVQSISELVRRGVMRFCELGPGNVLTRLVQEIRRAEDPQLGLRSP